MKTTVKKLNETKVELFIECGPEELDAAEKVALAKLAKTIKVPGFRKGNVPINIVAKHADSNTLGQDVLENAISKAVADAFMGEDIQVLERPQVEVKKYIPGKELEFTAEAEVLPEIKLGDYKKLKAKKQKSSVLKADVDEVVERMRTGFADKKEVKRAAKKGDEVVIDFVGKKDDEAFDGGSGDDYTLKLGSDTFIPGFEDGIIGHKAGDSFDLPLKFPDDYHAANLKGADVVFSITIKSVQEVVLPELNDEFAAKAGPFTAVDELIDDIKRELEAQKDRTATEDYKDALVAELVEKSTVPAPEVLISDQSRSIEQDMIQSLMYQGLALEQYLENKGFESREKWLETEVRDAATKRVQAGLVLAELSKVEDIKATTSELDEHVEIYKQQYSKDADAAKQFGTPEARQQIANRLLTEKTVDRLVELNSK